MNDLLHHTFSGGTAVGWGNKRLQRARNLDQVENGVSIFLFSKKSALFNTFRQSPIMYFYFFLQNLQK